MCTTHVSSLNCFGENLQAISMGGKEFVSKPSNTVDDSTTVVDDDCQYRSEGVTRVITRGTVDLKDPENPSYP